MVNVGSVDRTLRFVLGAALLVAPFVPQLAGVFVGLGEWKYAVAVAGAVFVGTAVFRICPAYMLFGVSTCEIGKR